MVSHHLTMSGGHCYIPIVDIKYLMCHVISQNHVIERSSNFMTIKFSWLVNTLPSFMAIGIIAVEICF